MADEQYICIHQYICMITSVNVLIYFLLKK